jgi:hypothetical protein
LPRSLEHPAPIIELSEVAQADAALQPVWMVLMSICSSQRYFIRRDREATSGPRTRLGPESRPRTPWIVVAGELKEERVQGLPLVGGERIEERLLDSG